MDKPVFALHPAKGKPGIPGNLGDRTLGLYLLGGPTKPIGQEEAAPQMTELNFTGAPGQASKLYYSLMFQLPKWGLYVTKADEWIEVAPTHQEYYQRTVATKRQLEGIIKAGLSSAGAAVADYELLDHDLRKYKEILEYYNKKDEHSLKAMFIDRVDVHNGAMSLIEMAKRWPTIIADFIRLDDKDDDIDKIAKKLKISKAASVVLTTKNKLYKNWKKTFLETVKRRYETISGMLKARERSVQEYKNWLKPYISRFKMTKLGGERPGVRGKILGTFADVTGQATFANGIHLFVWEPLKPKEIRKPMVEVKHHGFDIYPYDDFVRENFILNKKKGLAAYYPWLTDEIMYCTSCKSFYPRYAENCEGCGSRLIKRTAADKIVEKEIIPAWLNREMELDPTTSYYTFFDIKIDRVGTRLPVGELEDIIFNIKTFSMSHNILLVKLLEMKCRERELERYIDEILGLKIGESDIPAIVRQQYPGIYKKDEKPETEFDKFKKEFYKIGEEFSGFFGKASVPETNLMFIKPGPYERDFKDRITKEYLRRSAHVFIGIVKFIKSKMGVR